MEYPESILQNKDNSATSVRLRSFPRLDPTPAPGLRLEHCFVQLCIRTKTLEEGTLLLMLLEAFGLGYFHQSLSKLQAAIGRGRHTQGTTAVNSDTLSIGEKLLSDAQLRRSDLVCDVMPMGLPGRSAAASLCTGWV